MYYFGLRTAVENFHLFADSAEKVETDETTLWNLTDVEGDITADHLTIDELDLFARGTVDNLTDLDDEEENKFDDDWSELDGC